MIAAGRGGLRRRRHPGQQCRHPARRADRGVPDREMGRDHRDQPVRRPSTPPGPRCRGMKATGWGRIINTASAHSLVASPFKSAYVAAKHGIAGLTKTVALEVATHGITVNCISPGYVWTPLVEQQIPDTMKARGLTKEQVINDVLLEAQPTKEFVTVEQVAALAVFLSLRRGEQHHRRQPADGRRLDGRMSGRARQPQRAACAGSPAEGGEDRLARAAGRRRAWRLHLGRARRHPRGRAARHRGDHRRERRRHERRRAGRGLARGRRRGRARGSSRPSGGASASTAA